VTGLNGVTAIACGTKHSIALKNDGTVWTWGYGYNGELGNGGNSARSTPWKVLELSGVVAIAARGDKCLVLKNDGTVWAWGKNDYGQLGDGSTSSKSTPVRVSSLNGVTKIACGYYHCLAVKNDGTVWAWGLSNYGQLGNGTGSSKYNPVQVTGLSGVSAISCGDYHNIAYKTDGTACAWGRNDLGQLGDGTYTNKNTPVSIVLSDVTSLSCSGNTSGVLKSNGTFMTWGDNTYGQLCDGARLYYSYTPIKVKFCIINITSVAPIQNQSFGEDVQFITPSVQVSSPDISTLTCKYYLDAEAAARDTKTVSNVVAPQTVSFGELDVSTLQEGAHIIKFEVGESAITVTSTVNIIVNRKPVFGQVTASTTETGITVSCAATDGTGLAPTPYRFTVGTVVSSWQASSTYTAAGLIPNTLYHLTVEAKDTADNISTYSMDKYTKAAAPSFETPVPGTASFALGVNDTNPEDTQYQISCGTKYVSKAGALTSNEVWITMINKSIKVTGLKQGTSYSFAVKARNGAGEETVQSETINVTTGTEPLPAPPGVSAKALDGGSIRLTWKPVKGADTYVIEKDGDTVNLISAGTNLYYEDTGLASASTHKYRVAAVKETTNGNWSANVTAKTKLLPPLPPDTITTIAHGTSIDIAWSAAEGAISYDIELDGTVKKLKNVLTFTHKSLGLMSQHTYRLRARNLAGAGEWSAFQTVMTTDGMPGDISNAAAEATNTTITLSWDGAADAEGYDVVEVVAGTDGQIIDNGENTICEVVGFTPSSIHTYKIRAKNSLGAGNWSDPITVSTFVLGTPDNITTYEAETAITFNWDTVQGADSYELTVNGQDITGILETEYICTGLTPETQYTYKIRANSASGDGGWSREYVTATTPIKPGIPAQVSATVSDTAITLTWLHVSDAEGYDVELDGVILENDNTTTYIHDGLDTNTMHTYRVRARNSAIEGDWSVLRSIKTLPGKATAPEGIKLKSTATAATIAWDAKDGAYGYDIEISDGTTTTVIQNLSKTSYTQRRIVPYTEYRYRLRTRNVEGISDWTGYIINNAIKADCKKNSSLDLNLGITDAVDFTPYTMVVTYNPGVINVTDLCSITGQPELTTGKIEGTDITITEFSPGRIVFVCDKVVEPGEAWTGIINSIKFTAKETGGTTITYTVLCKDEE